MNASTATPTAWVFAGGGSFGAVQVGMLRALVAHGLAPDLVIGSSVGAINGAYFAGAPNAGGVAQLEAIWCGLRRREVFPIGWRDVRALLGNRDFAVDPSGLRHVIEQHLPYRTLERAAVPLHVVATDLLGGGTVRLSSGPVVEAVLASCAIPAAFPPVRIGEHYLVDGAIASNTPISVAVELGATQLIVLPTGFACSLAAPVACHSGRLKRCVNAENMMLKLRLIRSCALALASTECSRNAGNSSSVPSRTRTTT